MSGFTKDYWEKNYSDPEEMDGLANSTEHIQYLYCLFELENIKIKSIADFGFGLGKLLEDSCNIFEPKNIFALEPSSHAFEFTKNQAWVKEWRERITWSSLDLLAWCQKQKLNRKQPKFDLGICFSVMQYLEDDQLRIVSKALSHQCHYLYASMPTRKELKRQRSEFDFDDSYAIRRTRKKYLEILGEDWTIVGLRLLESKHFESFETSPFSDHLFRF